MLIEKRTYTLRPGCTPAFWRTQEARGFSLVRPILERLIGYFWMQDGPREQIVHLYRFDSYEDWVARLHGLYTVPELMPYFAAVRPLMLAQENEFLASAPLRELTPHWGNGNDRPVTDVLPPDLARDGGALVEQTITQLLPGKLPAYWQAWREHGLQAGPTATGQLLGTFYTQVGAQHRVTSWRWHRNRPQRDAHRLALQASPAWRQFQAATSELVAGYETSLLTPAPFAPMSPLFAPPKEAPHAIGHAG